jgi:hypothetical protein
MKLVQHAERVSLATRSLSACLDRVESLERAQPVWWRWLVRLVTASASELLGVPACVDADWVAASVRDETCK